MLETLTQQITELTEILTTAQKQLDSKKIELRNYLLENYDIDQAFDKWVAAGGGTIHYDSIQDIEHNGYKLFEYDCPPLYPNRSETFSIQRIANSVKDHRGDTETIRNWKTQLMNLDVASITWDW